MDPEPLHRVDHHRSLCTFGEQIGIDSPGRGELLGQDTQLTRDQHLARPSPGGQLVAHPGDTDRCRQHVDAGGLHDCGNRSAGGHSDVAPRGPVDGDGEGVGMLRPVGETRLAEQIVGSAVIGLAAIPEPSGDR